MIPPEYLDAIVTGDARELAERIPDESVHLILCDPPFMEIETYSLVAEIAARVLLPGGNLIAECGNLFLFDCYRAMSGFGLTPQVLLAEVYPFATGQLWNCRVMNGWSPFLWFSKGARRGGWLMDRMRANGRDKRYHPWGDSPDIFREIISRLTEPGEIVLDPFAGGGTVAAVCKQLGRRYIAFELSPETAERARQRVADTQVPLFVLEPEQLALDVAT